LAECKLLTDSQSTKCRFLLLKGVNCEKKWGREKVSEWNDATSFLTSSEKWGESESELTLQTLGIFNFGKGEAVSYVGRK
jgi:hypothetical protein